MCTPGLLSGAEPSGRGRCVTFTKRGGERGRDRQKDRKKVLVIEVIQIIKGREEGRSRRDGRRKRKKEERGEREKEKRDAFFPMRKNHYSDDHKNCSGKSHWFCCTHT